MVERKFQEIWRQQCEAARDIRARYGVDSALEYLVGEKLMHFAQAAEERADFVAELPAFAREVRSIFSLRELEGYFAKLDAAELELADDDPDAQDPLPEEERAEAFQQEQQARERRGWVRAMILNRGS
jgi:hypothetical protein